MELFFPNADEESSLSWLVPSIEENTKRAKSYSYLQAVRDLIADETQFIKDLNMLIHVFRAPLLEFCANDKTFVSAKVYAVFL